MIRSHERSSTVSRKSKSNVNNDYHHISKRSPVKFAGRRKRPWTKNILDLDRNAYFSRTPSRWVELLIFYMVFYSALACLFLVLLTYREGNLSKEVPDCLMSQPGLDYEPNTQHPDDEMHLLYRENVNEDLDPYIDKLYQFFKKFGPVLHDRFGECNRANMYGYFSRKPCVFLKVNRIIGFKAQTYDDANDLPLEAPGQLKTHVSNANLSGYLWFSCKSNNNDMQFKFFPEPQIDKKWVELDRKVEHPKRRDDTEPNFYNSDDWNRVVAVQLTNVPLKEAVLVRCYLWAKNIRILEDGKVGTGQITFKLEIKPSPI